MIRPPHHMGVFQFVALARLRVTQLSRGCLPKVDGIHTRAVVAQREIAEGKVTAIANVTSPAGDRYDG
ncbi:MAG TPA: hypothetical protein VF456_20450 [Vicinamibacterales bacterium]